MKRKMVWATQNFEGTLTVHSSREEAIKVAEWGNGLTVKRVAVYS